ncbi:MAG: hypothetical protein WB507_06570 [Solirubrobacterales bacterium]
MRPRFTVLVGAVLASALVCVAGAAAATTVTVGIYRNGMETSTQRAQMLQLSGRSCSRSGAEQTMVITLGKRTNQCSFRTPVIGRNLQIAASERLLGSTPRSLQRKVYLGLFLRTGGGGGYQLVVYPTQQKVQLRKLLPGGKVKYLGIARGQRAVGGVNRTNELTLQAIDGSGGATLAGYVGGKLLLEAVDPGARELSGGASGVMVGSTNAATGTVASFDNVVLRVPSPF